MFISGQGGDEEVGNLKFVEKRFPGEDFFWREVFTGKVTRSPSNYFQDLSICQFNPDSG